MSDLRIVSWNCHYEGGFNERKRAALKKLDAGIYVVQECTYSESVTFQKEGNFASSFWYGDGQDSDLGVAVFSSVTCKIDFTGAFNRNFRYVIPYRVTHGKMEFTLFAVWTKAPADGTKNYQKTVWEALGWYRDIITGAKLVIGDFNTFAKKSNGEYKILCDNLPGFTDAITKQGGEPDATYHDKGDNFGTDDFCFVSDSFIGKIVNAEVDNTWDGTQNKCCWRGLSDHCPIIVDFDYAQK